MACVDVPPGGPAPGNEPGVGPLRDLRDLSPIEDAMPGPQAALPHLLSLTAQGGGLREPRP